MMKQILSPGMEDGKETDLGAEVSVITGDSQQSLGGATEQNAVNRFGVIQGNDRRLGRDGENHVEVLDRQEFGLPVLQPFCPGQILAFRAVTVAAGVIRDAKVLAVAASIDMTAKRCRSADLDGAHDAQLLERERMHLAVARAVLSKDGGQLKAGPWQCAALTSSWSASLPCQPVNRADSVYRR